MEQNEEKVKDELSNYHNLSKTVTEKFHQTRDKKMHEARLFLQEKLNNLDYGNNIVSMSASNFETQFKVNIHDVRYLMEELKQTGWCVKEYAAYNIEHEYEYETRFQITINSELSKSSCPTMQDTIDCLKEENEKLKLHISLMPGGEEYLKAQKRFNEANNIHDDEKEKNDEKKSRFVLFRNKRK